jgi:bifunctional non-homologous end joining protein LigD
MKRPLDRYAEKRTFTKTPEPGPTLVDARCGPLLFLIQKHAARRLHYDFRLELDGVLKSWAVPKGPSLQVGDKRLAVEVEDHPFDYASFEGVIPEKQYGAGNVIVWDCGVYSPDEDEQYAFGNREEASRRLRDAIAAGKLSIFLRGEKLKGSFTLVRTTTDKQWLLMKHKDRFAAVNDVLARNRSVVSGLTLDDLEGGAQPLRLEAQRLAPQGTAEKMPKKLAPMLAESLDKVESDVRWLYEPKLDGYRAIAFIENGQIRLQSRRDGLELTGAFPEIAADLAAQAVDTMIVDGEIVVLDEEGGPSFNALQNRTQLKTPKEIAEARRKAPAVFVCFDLLHFAGVNLCRSMYVDRRRYLAQCLLPSTHIQLIHASSDARQLYEASLASGFEGIVAKRKDSPYQPGRRSPAWQKIKSTTTHEFVVGGYTKGNADREPLGALILGYFADNKLHYAGRVGSGLNAQTVNDLLERVKEFGRKTSPFVEKPQLDRPPIWLHPKMVVEVTFERWTTDGLLRSPVFVRVRDDVTPASVRTGPGEKRTKAGPRVVNPASEIDAVLHQLEGSATQMTLEVAGANVRLTNLDKVYWPAEAGSRARPVTKRDLLRYLAAVSPYMLPHLKDRPLTMIRMPEGIHGERFFQKHWDQPRPDFVKTVTVFSEHKNEKHDYVLADSLPTLLWLGQLGTLEFHVWHSRARLAADALSKSDDYSTSLDAMDRSVLNYPDYLVFDIDPYIYSGKEPEGGEPELNRKGFAMGRRVAFWIRALLREMSLDAIVKTSGKTGLHVFVAIERTVTFDEARHLCEMVGRHLVKEHPRDITMEWAVIKRTGKIFIDYNMNVRGKTLNVAYSPRGVAGAPVSMPLTWEELEAADPLDFTIPNVIARLEKTGDRWHDVLSIKHSLTKAFGSNSRTREPKT